MVQRDAVLMTRIKLTGNQHQLQLLQQYGKRLVKLAGFSLTKLSGDPGPVGQIMEAVAFLHQTSTQLRGDAVLQASFGQGDISGCSGF